MTDKQIIIDGVDVSGCEYYFDEKCRCMDASIMQDFYLCPQCNSNPNCHYKNWKRKEQECEELNKELHKNFEEKDTLHLIIDRLLEASGYDTNTASAEDFEDVYEHMRYEQQQLDQLKAENDELKKIIERLDVPKHEVIDMDIALENEKLKQTITEIKPILELYANSKVGEEQPDGTYKLSSGIWDSFGFCTTTYDPRPARQALQKISECEVTNER